MNEDKMPSLNAWDSKHFREPGKPDKRISYKGRYIFWRNMAVTFFIINIILGIVLGVKIADNQALRAGFKPELGTVTLRPSVLEGK